MSTCPNPCWRRYPLASTMRGARFMASAAARNNPHCQHVGDAERIAASIAREFRS